MALTRITKGVIKPNENYDTHNINSTGIVTAIGLDVNGNADISGSLSVGGVLTYEDVTSIDSVGIITARTGLVSPYADIDDFVSVGSNIHLGNAGVVTATSFVGSGAALTGIDATAIKDSGGNVKVQAQASGAVYTGIHTFNSDLDVDGHTNLDNVSIAGVTTMSGNLRIQNVYPIIELIDTNNNDDFEIRNADGIFIVRDATNSVDRLSINSSGGASITGSLFVSNGIDNNGDLDVDGHTNLDNVNIAGVSTFAGTLNASTVSTTALIASGDIDVDGHTNLDNVSIAGVVTATTFSGSGASLTNLNASAIASGTVPTARLGSGTANNTTFLRGDSTFAAVTSTTINNYASTRFVTATNNANELDAETNLTVNGSVVTFANSTLTINKSTNPTVTVTETAGSKSGQFRANTDGALLRSLGNYPLIFHTNQTERAQIDGSGRFLIGTNGVFNANSYSNNLIVYENGDAGASIIGNASNSNYASLYLSDTSTANKAYLEAQLGANGNFTIGAAGSGPIRFVNNGTEKVRIDGNGRVQINQTSNITGTAKLEVMGTGDNTYPQYSFAIGVADTQAYNVSNGSGMGIGFSYKHNSSGSYALGCGIRGFKENTTDGNYAGAMAFYTRPNGAGAVERVRITSNGQIQQLATGGDNQFVTKRTSAAGSNGDYYFHLFANNNSGTNMGALGIVRDTGNDNSRMMFYTANSGTNKERARINRWGGLQLRNIQPPYGSSEPASRYVYSYHRSGTYNTFWVEIRFAGPGSYCLDLRMGGYNNRNMHYTYQGYVYAGGDYSSAAAIDSGNGPQRYYSNQGAYNTYGTIIRFGFSSMSATHPVVHMDLSYGAAGGDSLAEITNMLWS